MRLKFSFIDYRPNKSKVFQSYLNRKSMVGLMDMGNIWDKTTLEVVRGIVSQEAREMERISLDLIGIRLL